MIFLNSNNRESHHNEESGRKTSYGRTSQPQLAKKSDNLRRQKLTKKISCKETTAKILAFIGVFGLLSGIGLLIFGIIQFVNKKDSSNEMAIASIASASALILVSIISLIAAAWILCFGKK